MNLIDFTRTSYETLLVQLHKGMLTIDQRERVIAELRSRDRAMHNQWMEICGGEFQ